MLLQHRHYLDGKPPTISLHYSFSSTWLRNKTAAIGLALAYIAHMLFVVFSSSQYFWGSLRDRCAREGKSSIHSLVLSRCTGVFQRIAPGTRRNGRSCWRTHAQFPLGSNCSCSVNIAEEPTPPEYTTTECVYTFTTFDYTSYRLFLTYGCGARHAFVRDCGGRRDLDLSFPESGVEREDVPRRGKASSWT